MRHSWHAWSKAIPCRNIGNEGCKASHSKSISGFREQVTLAASEPASNQSKDGVAPPRSEAGALWSSKHDSARRRLPQTGYCGERHAEDNYHQPHENIEFTWSFHLLCLAHGEA
jgi:hypothetical protein